MKYTKGIDIEEYGSCRACHRIDTPTYEGKIHVYNDTEGLRDKILDFLNKGETTSYFYTEGERKAIQKSIAHWTWLAENPGKRKENWPCMTIPKPTHGCYLCEAFGKKCHYDCTNERCPLFHCEVLGKPYLRWVNSKRQDTAAAWEITRILKVALEKKVEEHPKTPSYQDECYPDLIIEQAKDIHGSSTYDLFIDVIEQVIKLLDSIERIADEELGATNQVLYHLKRRFARHALDDLRTLIVDFQDGVLD